MLWNRSHRMIDRKMIDRQTIYRQVIDRQRGSGPSGAKARAFSGSGRRRSSRALPVAVSFLLILAVLLVSAAGPEKHLSVYSTAANYSLPIVQRQGHDYVGLLELLDPLGTVSANELWPPVHAHTLLWPLPEKVYVEGPTTGAPALAWESGMSTAQSVSARRRQSLMGGSFL